MKIVDFAGLVKSPSGTIFCEWRPHYMAGELSRLGSVIAGEDGEIIDFFYCDVLQFSPNGCGPCVSNIEGRDGRFDSSRTFLIWESDDIARVIRILLGTDTGDDGIWPDEPLEMWHKP